MFLKRYLNEEDPVVGLGYVGLAQAILLAQRFSVTCLDNDLTRVQMITIFK